MRKIHYPYLPHMRPRRLSHISSRLHRYAGKGWPSVAHRRVGRGRNNEKLKRLDPGRNTLSGEQPFTSPCHVGGLNGDS